MTFLCSIGPRSPILAGLVAVAVQVASAQRPDPELTKLRAEHEKSLASSSRLVDDIHRLTLRQLERERAEAGDYDTAALVKERLEAMERNPGAAAIVPPPLTHTLPAARALTRDGANTEGGREYVDFRKAGGKALWDVLGLGKGTFEVFLTYSVGLPRFDESALSDDSYDPPDAPGGAIAFSQATGLAGGTAPTLEKRVVSTGAWDNFIRESLGRYEFRNASPTVKLEATSATEGGVLRLRQIELVKVVGTAESAGPNLTDSEPTRLLLDLQARHRDVLRGITESLRPRFIEEFEKLEQSFTAAGDETAAAAVAKARRRLFPAPATGEATADPAADPLTNWGEDPDANKP
ncbi:MAG: hypothetical protein ACKV19_26830 [Verrucomicrobiales bacterium]